MLCVCLETLLTKGKWTVWQRQQQVMQEESVGEEDVDEEDVDGEDVDEGDGA